MTFIEQLQQVFTLVGSIFSVIGVPILIVMFYNNNRTKDTTKQENLDKAVAVSDKEAEGKDKLISQQILWEKDLNEKKFIEIGLKIDRALTLAENHTHTVDVKVDTLIQSQNQTNIEIAKLDTTIKLLMQVHQTPPQTTNIIKNT